VLLAVLVIVMMIAPVVQAQDTDEGSVCMPTSPDALGPYFIEDAPERDTLYPDDAPGDRLLVHGTVYLGDCDTPLEGAVVEVWQANDAGEYDFSDDFIGRGMIVTDEDGTYEFITVLPGEYEPRPQHIHFRISHPEREVLLVTQLYFEGTYNGALPTSQVATLEDFDLGDFLADRLEDEADAELDEDAVAALEAQYEDVLYIAAFDIVLIPQE
jgi:protocatechuate 3,4-dioxygenase beta subunit